MISFLKKNWAIIGFIISFILDSQYKILETLFNNNEFWINIIRGLGVFVVAYFTDKKLGFLSKEDDSDIGGGGIKNPPKT